MAKRKRKSTAKPPRRTREHIIASQSHNYIEKFFIDKGHTVDRPTDYGMDILINTFDADGYAENGDIRIQLKASDGFKISKDASYLQIVVESKHYELWVREPMPVFLILYDAKLEKAYWLYLQEYFSASSERRPRKNAATLTIRVPVGNTFGSETEGYMRQKKAEILEQIKGQITHHG